MSKASDGAGKPISETALREAQRQLTYLEDAQDDVEGTIFPWVTAARQAVREALQEASEDA